MESRKLIQSGPSSLVVSLPNWWLKDNHLSKGMSIEIEELGNDLRLFSNKANKFNEDKDKDKLKRYYLKNKEPYIIEEELIYCFLNNISEIELPLDLVRTVKPLLNKVPGAEIRISRDKAVIYNLLEKKEVNPKKEINYCLKSAEEIFKQICEVEKEEDTYELISLLKNILRRLIITESFVNELIIDTKKRASLKYNILELVQIKQVVRELPILLKHELRLIKLVMYYKSKNIKKILSQIEEFFPSNFETKQEEFVSVIKRQIKIKSKIEVLTNQLLEVHEKGEAIIIDQTMSILHSLRRISTTTIPLI
ncbi:hypothetical protein COY27_06690 [Candidatus Woesearchaeota archaeon CG_4_10_14_0_2_um_filter_33_13]|nr:MAG: hypothetical protein COY27_06690 [Candidatus Woesearchaeota archaeon CG_4_10_14_0_2_um_filter_33_13]